MSACGKRFNVVGRLRPRPAASPPYLLGERCGLWSFRPRLEALAGSFPGKDQPTCIFVSFATCGATLFPRYFGDTPATRRFGCLPSEVAFNSARLRPRAAVNMIAPPLVCTAYCTLCWGIRRTPVWAFRCSMHALMCDSWSTFAFIGRRLVLPCPRQHYRTCATLHVRSAVEVNPCMRMQRMHVGLLRPRPGYNSSQRPTTRAAVNGISHRKIV
jgi:hypothetical protein